MNIFIICSVRQADPRYLDKLNGYANRLRKIGHTVHLPSEDTNQRALGINICHQNKHAINQADEVHVFYSSKSQGTHFDLGMAFMAGKHIVVVENEKFGVGKSFPRMLMEWTNNG